MPKEFPPQPRPDGAVGGVAAFTIRLWDGTVFSDQEVLVLVNVAWQHY